MRELISSIILVMQMITQNLYPFLISNQPSPATAPKNACWVFLTLLPKVDSFLILVTVPKMPNLSLIPLKPSCHPQHDIRDAVLKYAIALLNK